ncbi:MAG: Maf family protein, partial [Saezia sp.]
MTQDTLILASTSRYRKELLERFRVPFTTQKPEVDETPLAGETPARLCERLALLKAQAVAHQYPQAIVIGSDQVADLDGHIIGKPGNYERAVQQLQMMSGKTVIFQTALAVVNLSNHF